jgi:homocysteine S-methyltransferase
VKTPVASQPNAQQPVAREEKSALARQLVNGRFVRAVELVPPRGHAATDALTAAARLANRRVDVVMIPDGPRSGARMSALSMAVLVQQHAAVEALLQYSCRDRNLLGIQSDLLGAHAMGVRNVLGITGDVRNLGDIPDATAVFDVDSIGLTNVINRLNHGLDIGGQSIGEPTAFHAGVMVNPSRDLDQEVRRLEFKVEAGAEFAVTRPVFDIAAFERFLKRVERMGLPIIVGIWPFESALNAEFMANEVPSVTVPDALVERMRTTATADHALAEGVAIAREIVAAVSGMAAGVQVSSPSGRLDAALDVLDVV